MSYVSLRFHQIFENNFIEFEDCSLIVIVLRIKVSPKNIILKVMFCLKNTHFWEIERLRIIKKFSFSKSTQKKDVRILPETSYTKHQGQKNSN